MAEINNYDEADADFRKATHEQGVKLAEMVLEDVKNLNNDLSDLTKPENVTAVLSSIIDIAVTGVAFAGHQFSLAQVATAMANCLNDKAARNGN